MREVAAIEQAARNRVERGIADDPPDPAALESARVHIRAALRAILDAENALKDGGWAENAKDLHRSHTHLAVWTAPGGWLDCLK